MPKSILKYEFWNGSAASTQSDKRILFFDVISRKYDITAYNATYNKDTGVNLNGTTGYIENRFDPFPIPIAAPYTIKCVINPQRSVDGRQATLISTVDKNYGLVVCFVTNSGKDTITLLEKSAGTWVNNTYNAGNMSTHIPKLYDGGEKELVIHNPNIKGEYITAYIDGVKYNETLINQVIPIHSLKSLVLGKMSDVESQPFYYKGYIKSFELIDENQFQSYLLMDSETQDLFSYRNEEIVMVGNMNDADIDSLIKGKGVELPDLYNHVLPKIKKPFKIITIQ